MFHRNFGVGLGYNWFGTRLDVEGNDFTGKVSAVGPVIPKILGGNSQDDEEGWEDPEAEIDRLQTEIRAVAFPTDVRRRIEFFASQFEFFEPAAEQLEYKTKDTAKLSGIDFRALTALDTGKDKVKDIGAATKNGFSVRALMTVLVFAKALAFFRGNKAVSLDDLRNIVPAHFIRVRMETADSMVLFSATLNPADYYINLLGLPEEEDVAEAALFLASEAARRTTGHCLPVESGILIS